MKDILLSLIKCLHHTDDLLSPVDHELALLQQLVKDIGLVQLLEKLFLEVFLRVVHERERDRLGHHVDHLALDDIEVGVDEEFCVQRRTMSTQAIQKHGIQEGSSV